MIKNNLFQPYFNFISTLFQPYFNLISIYFNQL
jgi:hypothetical protein